MENYCIKSVIDQKNKAMQEEYKLKKNYKLRKEIKNLYAIQKKKKEI